MIVHYHPISKAKPPKQTKQPKQKKEKTERFKTLKQSSFLQDNKNLLALFLLCIIFIIFISVNLIVDNKSVVKRDKYTIVHGSQQLNPDTYPTQLTQLEKLGVENNLYKGTNGHYVCSDCGKNLDDEFLSQYICVITQADSFIKIILCEKCFTPFGVMLSSIGKK